MDVRLLGPLEARIAGIGVPVTSPKQRIVLATLALRANRVVGADELIDRVWDSDPPATARATLHNHVMRLRRLLSRPGAPLPLRTRAPGYLLAAETDEIDVLVFERHRAAADVAHRRGDRVDEAAQLRAALALCRGGALADVSSQRLHEKEALGWDERTLDALERRIEADLALGRHGDVLGELRALIGEHPLRERPRALLMIALHRADRRADALAAFQDARRALVDEVGVEPGRALREVHAAILNDDDPRLDDPRPRGPARRRPAELPRDDQGFTGRAVELATLDGARTARLVVISGTAGAGKTALAVHWAHSVADRFPHGQLYLDLRGFDEQHEPVPPVVALAQLLRSLGVAPQDIPDDPDEQSRLYRSSLAGMRVLLVLDNARSAEQVRPLLPGAPDCVTVITSRNQLNELVALDGATPLPLDRLAAADAGRLLTRLVPSRRLGSEDAVELARLCGHLPLALRIAAANLAGDPRLSAEELIAELRTDGPLVGLTVPGDEEGTVARALRLSYATLSAEQRRLFRRLGLVPGLDVTAASAAAVAGRTATRASRLLKALAAASLVEHHQQGRYRLHDLLRRYAVDRAADEDPADVREAAIGDLFEFYLNWADAAGRRINPEFTRVPCEPRSVCHDPPDFAGPSEAVDWFGLERENLVAAIRHAAEHGPDAYAWTLADAVRSYFHGSGHAVQWKETAELGMRAARRADDTLGQAGMQLNLATQAIGATEFERAIELLRLARKSTVAAGWDRGSWAAVHNLAAIHEHIGRPREALAYAQESVARTAGKGPLHGETIAKVVLAQTYVGLGRLDHAAEQMRAAADLDRAAGLEVRYLRTIGDLGFIQYELGLLDEAERNLSTALASYRRFAAPAGQADALAAIATVRLARGDPASARTHLAEALELVRPLPEGEPLANVLWRLADVERTEGNAEHARRHHRQALHIAEQTGHDAVAVSALIGLAKDELELGRPSAGVRAANRARALARRTGSRLREGHACAALARCYANVGNTTHALRWAECGLVILSAAGARLAAAELRRLIGDCSAPVKKKVGDATY